MLHAGTKISAAVNTIPAVGCHDFIRKIIRSRSSPNLVGISGVLKRYLQYTANPVTPMGRENIRLAVWIVVRSANLSAAYRNRVPPGPG
jgi:hypothetical protein